MLQHIASVIILLAAAASGSLVNAVAQGLFLTGLVALSLRLLPQIKPAARFFIWLSVLVAVVMLHMESGLRGAGTNADFTAHTPSLHLDARWAIPIAALWFAVSVARLLALMRSAIELRRIAKSATPVDSCAQHQHLLKTRLRAAQLCTSHHVDRPSVAGFFHPRILLPQDLLARLSPQQLEQILLHEMEHLRRFDDWTNLLQKLALVFFPLNPALLWIERRLCRERELACDDCVLSFTGARKTYATCLTSLAEHTMVRRGVTLALGAWEKQSELSRRIHRILNKPEVRMKPVLAKMITSGVLTGLLGGAILLAHTPELISFAPPVAASEPAATTAAAASVPENMKSSRSLAPTFVKAVMPEGKETLAKHRSAAPARPRTVRAIHHAAKPQPQKWVVLTRWQSTAVRQYPVVNVSETSGTSYAAVPVGNGWLIIQL